jgi:glycerol-3-phosphate dehydrogenase
LRPIVDANDAADPATASREEAIWSESGLLTVTGGKLTTFQRTAQCAVAEMRARVPGLSGRQPYESIHNIEHSAPKAGRGLARFADRILSRYGPASLDALRHAFELDLQELQALGVSRFEFQWVAEHESVLHLDDLLLRRLRVGLTACEGGRRHLEAIRPTVQRALGWDSVRWRWETERYDSIWEQAHGVPRTS